MDGDAVESLVEKLRDLSATGFPGSGFSSPDVEATVTSSDGKQVERCDCKIRDSQSARMNRRSINSLPPRSPI